METIVAAISDTQEPTVSHDQEIQELTNIFTDRLPSLTRIAARLVGNAADAEDAVQDAFVSAYTHVDQFRGQAQMSTWLTTIVINAARMKVRRRPRQTHIPLDQQDREQNHAPLSDMLPDRRPSPEELCLTWELEDRLVQLSTQLSPILCRTFELSELDGLSTRETAQALGIPHGTVKTRVARARRKLKQLLQTQVNRCRDDNSDALPDTDCVKGSREIGGSAVIRCGSRRARGMRSDIGPVRARS
jgi:RNA polymerase sigma-70 factor (ECF subfamily)